MEIDVSKCPHKDTCMYICDNVQDCLYKNYKRLVHTNNATKRARDDYKNIANKLKAENKNLKQQIKTYAKVNEEDTKEWLKCRYALDEIEKYCEVCRQARTLNIETILQLIKQVKEGE